MTINIDLDDVVEVDDKFDFDYKEAITNAILETHKYCDCPFDIEVNVLLTTNEAIHVINRETRDIDRATDVLSFPMIEYTVPADFSGIEDDISLFHPDTGELMLGDIVISYDKVLSQAAEYNHSVKRELAFLTAHSMLHLLGYDHMTKDDEKLMFSHQEEIMNELGITR